MRYTINDLMSDDIGVLEDITDKVLKGEIVLNDIISTFNDLYYKIQISHNICLADVRNICLKSYNNSVVCDVDGSVRNILRNIREDCGHFVVLKIERNSHEIIYESVNADFAAIALFLFLSRHQIKKLIMILR